MKIYSLSFYLHGTYGASRAPPWCHSMYSFVFLDMNFSFFSHSCWFTKIFHFFKSWKGQWMDALHFPRISACLGLGSANLSWEAQFSNDLWGVFRHDSSVNFDLILLCVAGLQWWLVAGPWTPRRGPSFSSWSSVSQSFTQRWVLTCESSGCHFFF